MKRVYLIVSLLLLVFLQTMQAELRMDPSGTRDMFIRVNTTDRYLILPVEEAAPEYLLRVMENGVTLRELKIRLAARGKVDYYVPFDLSAYNQSALLLDLHVWEERQLTWIAFDEIRTAATTDGCILSANDDFYPIYHHTPTYGWMNDPNGMFYKDGVWHLYYQWNPYCSLWQNMTWGHSSSTDLIHWEHHAAAIEPDGLGTIFSGSAALDKKGTAGYGNDAVVAMYTAAEITGQSQCLAYSVDGGMTFRRYEGNPTVTAGIPDFRDPNFFWNEATGAWNLVLAAGQEVRFYSSPDLKHWTYESSFGTGYGNHDGVWECPDLFFLREDVQKGSEGKEGTKGKWVLLLNINPGGPNGGSATQYFIGEWDGHTFTCEHTEARWMDYGKDHYATVSFSDAPAGRRTVIGWMSNWQYANQVPTRQYRSANTIARDLYLYTANGHSYLASRPSPEYDGDTELKKAGLDRSLKIRKGSTITLSNDEGEQLIIRYDEKAMTLSVDRSKSGITDFSPEFANAPAIAPVYRKIRNIRLFIDRTSVELFANDGEVCMTTLVFPKSTYNKVSVK